MKNSTTEFRRQWVNPEDVLSVLLIIGGDIVRKAIAQLVGCELCLPYQKGTKISIAPVAFSFGWVAYGFSNLLSAVGDQVLMPMPERSCLVVACSNGFTRNNQSWILSRLLQNHEAIFKIDARPLENGGRGESIRIDIFSVEPATGPTFDSVWWLGWVTIVAQIGIAAVPWIISNEWEVMLIVLCGNLLAAITCALPQWTREKWASPILKAEKIMALTRGNGHQHLMVFICPKGTLDMEKLATGYALPRPETRWISLLLAASWILLVIAVSGIKNHTWFIIGIGGIGMLQNIYAAGAPRSPSTANFHITPFSRAPTIIGREEGYMDEADDCVNLEEDLKDLAEVDRWALRKSETRLHPSLGDNNNDDLHVSDAHSMPRWLASMSKSDGAPAWLEPKPVQNQIIYATGVHGALMELEKWVPTAGIANVQIFFPSGLSYMDERIRDNIHKKFWKRAYHTARIRKRVEQQRRWDAKTSEQADSFQFGAEAIRHRNTFEAHV